MEKLPRRQRQFVLEYTVDRNATQSAIKAGYSKATAGQEASRLLKNVKIRAEIDKEILKQENRTLITADRVLKELGKIAYADIKKLFDRQGNLLPIQDIPKELISVISSIDNEETSTKYKKYKVNTKKIRLWDKLKALEMIAKHIKLFGDNADDSKNVNLKIQVETVKK